MIIGKFGKRSPKIDSRTLQLRSYLAAPGDLRWNEIPAARDWREHTTPTGAQLPPDDDPLGNDVIGNCTVASKGHALLTWSAITGAPVIVTRAGIVDAYSAITGYVPGKPQTDNGAYMLDVMKYWRNVGICGQKILAFAAVDPTNDQEWQIALEMFGGIFAGYDLPLTIQGRDVWDVPADGFPPGQGPGSLGGHEIYEFASSPAAGAGNSWGYRASRTRAFRHRCCAEAFVVLWEHFALPRGVAPNGFALDDLLADLRARTDGDSADGVL